MIVSTSHYFHIIYYLEGKKKCRLGPMPSFPLSPTLLFKVSTRRRSNWSACTVALFFWSQDKISTEIIRHSKLLLLPPARVDYWIVIDTYPVPSLHN